MLSGGDYTDGVQGIGCVTALEVLAHFRNPNVDLADDPLLPLRALKRWFAAFSVIYSFTVVMFFY